MPRLSIAAVTFGILLFGAAPHVAAQECAPDGDVQFICGPVSPEDFAPVPDSPWVIVSSWIDDGPMYAVDTRDRRVIDIFPEPAGALSGPVGDPRDRRGGLELRAAPEQRPESRSSYRIEEK